MIPHEREKRHAMPPPQRQRPAVVRTEKRPGDIEMTPKGWHRHGV